MNTTPPPNVSELLVAWGQGDEAARDRLAPIVYDELRRVAHHCLRRDRQQQTLQTSALINEAFVELIRAPVSWQNRAHFFGIAARLMRQILVHYAEARRAQKRGGGAHEQLSLTALQDLADSQSTEVLALNEALQMLAAVDAQKSHVVELRFFGGLTIEETAEALRISTATVEREWRAARAWLQTQLRKP